MAHKFFSPSLSPASFSRNSSTFLSPVASPGLVPRRRTSGSGLDDYMPEAPQGSTAAVHAPLYEGLEAKAQMHGGASPLVNPQGAAEGAVQAVELASHGRNATGGWELSQSAILQGGAEDGDLKDGRKAGGAMSPLSFDTWSHLTGDVTPPPEEEEVKETLPPGPSAASTSQAVVDALGEWQQVSGGKWKVKT